MIMLWFLAAFGFAFVVGHSKISLVMRELLGGIPGALVSEEKIQTGNQTVTMAAHYQPPIEPLIPFFGPWLAALLECVSCLGWWSGLVAGASGLVAVPAGLSLPWWAAGLFLAFATSAVNLLLAKYVGIV